VGVFVVANTRNNNCNFFFCESVNELQYLNRKTAKVQGSIQGPFQEKIRDFFRKKSGIFSGKNSGIFQGKNQGKIQGKIQGFFQGF
jgi:hypothetical protein